MRRALAIIAGLGLAALLIALALGLREPLIQWAMATQRDLQNALARALRALRAGEPGAWAAFLWVCFGYGFVHAVGPGHGKFLVGAYGTARPVGLARLSAVAVIASLGQAVTAVALVVGGIHLLGASRKQLTALADVTLTRLGLMMAAGIGLWLMLRSLRRIRRILRPEPVTQSPQPSAPATLAHDHPVVAHHHNHHHHHHHHDADQPCDGHGAGGHDHGHDHAPDQACGHAHDHGHPGGHAALCGSDPVPLALAQASDDDGLCPDCGHRHAPDPRALAGADWRGLLAVIGAIAIRPCSSALLLLVLSWQMNILGAGIAGTFAMAAGTAAVTLSGALLAGAVRAGALAGFAAGRGLRLAAAGIELVVGAGVVLVGAAGMGWL